MITWLLVSSLTLGFAHAEIEPIPKDRHQVRDELVDQLLEWLAPEGEPLPAWPKLSARLREEFALRLGDEPIRAGDGQPSLLRPRLCTRVAKLAEVLAEHAYGNDALTSYDQRADVVEILVAFTLAVANSSAVRPSTPLTCAASAVMVGGLATSHGTVIAGALAAALALAGASAYPYFSMAERERVDHNAAVLQTRDFWRRVLEHRAKPTGLPANPPESVADVVREFKRDVLHWDQEAAMSGCIHWLTRAEMARSPLARALRN